jgi:hypothetical protein
MKRELTLLFLTIITITLASAACTLTPKLINQDPYPAIPGEYTKVVFQLEGLEDPKCKDVSFQIIEEFPFSLDKGSQNKITAKGGFYIKDYETYLLAPYKLRIDKNALDGENPIEIKYSYTTFQSQPTYFVEQFNITVKDVRTDFETHIQRYSYETKELTLELLNIGKENVDAVTIEIPEQKNIEIIGPKRKIIGDIDSNEDDRITFTALPKEGDINLKIIYTDQTGTRRTLEKQIFFNPNNFNKSIEEKSGLSSTMSFILGILIPIAILFIYRWNKKRKQKNSKHHH